MKFFSMPADFKSQTIDEYEILNKEYKDSRVLETYGNITLGANYGSGRVVAQLPRVDLLDLRSYIEYSKQRNIDFNYTLNIPFWNNKEFTREGVIELKVLLKDLYEVGVRSLTIAMPSLIDLVLSSGYDFEIKASAICHITNPNKAMAYKKMGADRIVIDESIHRDFFALKRIVEVVGDKIEIIVNTMCHRNCAYRHFHYNETGGDSTGQSNEIGVNFFEHKCLLQRYDSLSELLKLGWVRPEDLKHYVDRGIRYFKLQGRQHVGAGGHIKTLKHYMDEDYDGNLMELLDMFNTRYSFKVHLDNKKLDGFLKPFLENQNFCRYDCENCAYCKSFAKQCIDHHKGTEVIKAAKKFYREYNQFEKLIETSIQEHDHTRQNETDDLDFNF